jgi:hypothetical protein
MQESGPVERLWLPRLRWRMRGAWQWPAFAMLTLLDGVVLTELPFYDRGPGSLAGGWLLATFFNLIAVAVVAPVAGRWLRRRRPDLPRSVAADYAGTAAIVAAAVSFLVGGVLHRPAVDAQHAEVAAVVASTHEYVVAQAPAYRRGLTGVDPMRVEDGLYRSCVPGADPQRWLCLFVHTDQHPAGVTRDPDEAPNAVYRYHGGFR